MQLPIPKPLRNTTAFLPVLTKRWNMVHSAKSENGRKSKGQKRERDLKNHYGAIRIGTVAGALHHHRSREASSRQTNRSPKPKRED
jgi:hypothetical protein